MRGVEQQLEELTCGGDATARSAMAAGGGRAIGRGREEGVGNWI